MSVVDIITFKAIILENSKFFSNEMVHQSVDLRNINF